MSQPSSPAPVAKQPSADLNARVFDFVRQGQTEAVAAYFAEGHTPNITNERGDSLLILAAYYCHADLVKLLLQQPNIEVDFQNGMGFTALTGATFRGDVGIMQQLITAGSNINHCNLSGQTALMFAALGSQTEAAKLLLANGADAKVRDQAGKDAATLAQEQGAAEIIQILGAV